MSVSRLLLVTQSYLPEIGAGATRLSSLAHYLSHLGWTIDVLTGFPNYPAGVILFRSS